MRGKEEVSSIPAEVKKEYGREHFYVCDGRCKINHAITGKGKRDVWSREGGKGVMQVPRG